MAWARKPGARLAAAALAAAACLGLAAALGACVDPSDEAVVREAVCRRLVANSRDGRQALVSSVWWPPLPTLVRLPLVYLFPGLPEGAASRTVSLAFGLATLAVVYRGARHWAGRRMAGLAGAATALHPWFLAACADGGSATTAAFLATLAGVSFVRWAREDRLTHLVVAALAAALLGVTSFECTPWILALFALMLAREATAFRLRRQREATLILAFLPAVYAAGLWLLGNWLIMEDGLYFLRSFSQPPAPGAIGPEALATCGALLVPAAPALLLAGLALRRRALDAGALAALALAPAAGAWWLAAGGRLFNAVPVLLPIVPLGALALARTAGALPLWRRFARRGLGAAALAIPVLAALVQAADPGRIADALRAQTDREASRQAVEEIRRRVLARTPSAYVRIYVCGHESFLLLGGTDDRVFLHEPDFDFERAKREYPGHALYLLIRRPEGRAAMESVHWKYPDVYAFGYANTLYDGDWHGWRLFEIMERAVY